MRTSRHSRIRGTSLSSQERVWDIYERDGSWYLNQRGRMRPPYVYSSREEAEEGLREHSSL